MVSESQESRSILDISVARVFHKVAVKYVNQPTVTPNNYNWEIYFKTHSCGCWQAWVFAGFWPKANSSSSGPIHRAVDNMVACFPQSENCKREKEPTQDRSTVFSMSYSYHHFCHMLLVIETNPNTESPSRDYTNLWTLTDRDHLGPFRRLVTTDTYGILHQEYLS